MRIDFSALSGILFCPDDGRLLSCAPLRIDCPRCARNFPIFANGIAEILPSCPAEPASNREAKYWQAYSQAFRERFAASEEAIAWGAPEVNPQFWIERRLRQTRAVEPLLDGREPPSQQVLCDISAGAGHYTLAYCRKFQMVLHCDLSVSNLNYVARRASALGLKNLFLLRTDYFALPFRNCIDRVLCLDTLVRGEGHEIAVLKSIRSALAPNGRAVVDFHNWWHNPIRRLGLLPENFHENCSYSSKQTRRLMCEAGVTRFDFFRFHQEFETGNWYRALLSRVIPATRLLVRFDGGQPCEC